MYHGLQILVPLLLLTCFAAGTEYFTRCADADSPDLVFEPSGSVAARYSLEWCANITGKVLNLEVDLFTEKIPKVNCDKRKYISKAHSSFKADHNEVFNCSRVCFLSNVDLVYAGCYNLMYKVLREDPECGPHPCTTSGDYTQYVENDYTADNFTRSIAIADHQSYGDISVVTFNFGNIPVTDFKVDLCNESIPWPAQQCATAADTCRATAAAAVRCEWRTAPGNYSAVFTHLAPWTHGAAPPPPEHRAYFVHVGALPAPHVSPPRTLTSSLSWSAAAALLVAAAGVTAVFVRRRRTRATMSAVPDSDTSGCGGELTPAADAADILLLYARDSQLLCDAMRELRGLLQQSSSGQVHDLYSPGTAALLAADAAGWVRGTLRRARTLVVLTPYLALNVTGYDSRSDNFKRSLLGSEVVYKDPVYGDHLLTVALDQLQRYCDTSEIAEYERVVVAEFPEHPTQLFTDLAALTRYSLPGDLAPLVARLAGAAPARGACAAARRALAGCAAGLGGPVVGRLQPI